MDFLLRTTGFFVDPSAAREMIAKDPRLSDVLRRHTNGDDLYDDVRQRGSRYVIDFGERSIEKARRYAECFEIVEETVYEVRAKQTDRRNSEKWWLHARPRAELYETIRGYDRVLALAKVSRTCAVDYVPADEVLDEKLVVFAVDRLDAFAVLQSCFHWEWAWFRCTTMKHDISYGVQRIFATLPSPLDFRTEADPALQQIGEKYHGHRKALMLSLRLGLTKIYNLFHARDLSPEMVVKVSKKDADTAAAGHEGLVELRRLHVELDTAVRDAYGWQDLDLGHDFHEVETLPENDRVRYTISPAARKEVLKRLLAENHRRAAAEAEAAAKNPSQKPKSRRKKSTRAPDHTGSLFPEEK